MTKKRVINRYWWDFEGDYVVIEKSTKEIIGWLKYKGNETNIVKISKILKDLEEGRLTEKQVRELYAKEE